MPPDWVEGMYRAVLSARERKIRQLLEQIPQENSPLTQTLTDMVERLDYESIVNLIEPLI